MQDALDMEGGKCDNWLVVTSFARHRITALRSCERAEAEAAEARAEVERLRMALWANQNLLERNERSQSTDWHEVRLRLIANREMLRGDHRSNGE